MNPAFQFPAAWGRHRRLDDAQPHVCCHAIGDKTGQAIIALIYGDVRPDHLPKQA